MQNAVVGDDLFGEDPTVNQLQEKVAGLFGHEAALYCPSGTMANQVAIKTHTQPGDDIICAEKAHIYQYEGGGVPFNSGCSLNLIPSDNGIFTAEEVKSRIRPDDIHFPSTKLVSLENTCNKGGGSIWKESQLKEVCDFAHEQGLLTHLDGARLFNAHVKEHYNLKEWGQWFDSISICLSKGLGAPIGSVISGNHSFIKKALRVRKVFGGGMRQAGYLAAAGIFALDHHIDRLEIDNKRAAELRELLLDKPFIEKVYPVETNMVIFSIREEFDGQALLDDLKSNGIIGIAMGHNLLRFVFHLDVSPKDFDKVKEILDGYSF